MTKNPQLRRIVIALLTSAALNGILLVLDSSTDPQRRSQSVSFRIVEILFAPSGTFAEWLVPAGHDAAHILGAMVVSIVSSVIFYGVLVWAILTIWARAHREGSNQSGAGDRRDVF
jgi:hypothetical protein